MPRQLALPAAQNTPAGIAAIRHACTAFPKFAVVIKVKILARIRNIDGLYGHGYVTGTRLVDRNGLRNYRRQNPEFDRHIKDLSAINAMAHSGRGLHEKSKTHCRNGHRRVFPSLRASITTCTFLSVSVALLFLAFARLFSGTQCIHDPSCLF
jgi:hypothetical protein